MVEYLAFVALIVFLVWIWKRKPSATNEKKAPSVQRRADLTAKPAKPVEQNYSKAQKVVINNSEWMEEKWKRLKSMLEAGLAKDIPQWYFDQPTSRQLEKLEELGLTMNTNGLTKGEVSDLIGLFFEPETNDLEVLKLFKANTKGLNQSKARYLASQLLDDQQNREAWDQRPATQMQKEFFRFAGAKAPSSLTYELAEKHITDYLDALPEDSDLPDRWGAYQSIFEEINEPSFRDDHETGKVSLALYREVISSLLSKGHTLEAVALEPEIIAEEIIKRQEQATGK